MKYLFKFLLLGAFFLLSTPTTTQAYNFSWSTHEDITKPCPGSGCDKKCKNPCGCHPDGTAKECECKPSATVCCLDNPPTGKTSSPVYSKNGAFTWSETDISLIAKPSLVLRRTYTAYDAHLGLFGNAWISEFEKLFIETVKYTKDNNDTQSSDIYYILRLTNGSRYSYKYDENNNALIDTGKLQVKAKRVDAHHTTLTYKNGLVETYEDGYLMEKKDRSGNILTLIYDDTKLLQSVQSGSATLTFTYNSNGFVSQVTDHTDRAWQYNYDEYGNLTGITNPLGGTKTYAYQAYKESFDAQIDYLITDISDEEGRSIVSTTYNSDGRVHSYTEGTLTYTYAYVDANTIKKTDNNGNVLTFVMDDDGFIVKTKYPNNAEVEEIYNENNRITTTVDANSNKWLKKQDETGRIIEKTSPLGVTVKYEYVDDNTLPSKIISPSGDITSVMYNDQGRATKINYKDMILHEFEYDNKGYMTKKKDGNGNIVNYSYNNQGLIEQYIGALGRKTVYGYDEYGNIITITNNDGKKTIYEYDQVKNLINSTDSSGDVVKYKYNKVSQPISIEDPIGNKMLYKYDNLGRVSEKVSYSGESTTYQYNNIGLTTEIVREDGEILELNYDNNNRLVEKKWGNERISYKYNIGGKVAELETESTLLQYSYTKDGLLANEMQNGINIIREYDENNYLKTLKYLGKTINYTRNKLGNLKLIETDGKIYSFEYDKNGILVKIIYPNDTEELYKYNAAYELTKITTSNNIFEYLYNTAGRIINKKVNNDSYIYAYDNKHRLKKENNSTFIYDKAGNELSHNSIYDTNTNRIIENNEYEFKYDKAGNLIKKAKKDGSKIKTYSYSKKDELISVVTLDNNNTLTHKLSYSYDALNRRYSKTVNGETVYYLYDKFNLIAILDQDKNIISHILHAEKGNTPLSITTDGETYFYFRDNRKSIIALTNSVGDEIETITYTPYGKMLKTSTKNTGNPFGYIGREYDSDDLYYFKARYYDPTTKNFLQKDPSEYKFGDYNFYRYSYNDPINISDPSGLNGLVIPRPFFMPRPITLPRPIVRPIPKTVPRPVPNICTDKDKDKDKDCKSCPEPPPPYSRTDQVPPSAPHWPCAGTHTHHYTPTYNQNPVTCECFLKDTAGPVDCHGNYVPDYT